MNKFEFSLNKLHTSNIHKVFIILILTALAGPAAGVSTITD